jgi:predicted nucleic acid-binding protein
MLLLVSDANVLIDIECGNLTRELFALPFQFAIPDVLFEEELQKRHSNLIELGLKKLSLKPEYVQRISELAQTYRKPSRLDLFALSLAQQERATLLTGDADLRKAAEAEKVSCHGTIWLVCQLVEFNIISLPLAEMAFMKMKEAGSRLPEERIRQEISKMKKQCAP